jgi:hypothetical protein
MTQKPGQWQVFLMSQNLVEKLKEELELRRKKNPRYSLRAMARDLGVSPSCLSRTLNGKTKMNSEREERIAGLLGLLTPFQG